MTNHTTNRKRRRLELLVAVLLEESDFAGICEVSAAAIKAAQKRVAGGEAVHIEMHVDGGMTLRVAKRTARAKAAAS